MNIFTRFFILLGIWIAFGVLVKAQSRLDSIEKALPNIQKPILRADVLNELVLYYLERNVEKALQYAQEARQISEEQSYPLGEAVARTCIGDLYGQGGNYDGAVNSYVKALKIADTYNLPIQKLKILNSIAMIYRNQKNYDKAIKQFTEALQIAEKLDNKETVATCENYLGGCYYLSRDYKTALFYYENALAYREETKDTLGISKLKNNIGLILKRQGKFAEALKNFEFTQKIQEKNGSIGGLAIVLDNIGDTYFAQNNLPKALQYQLKGLQLARQVNHKNVLLDAYESLTQTYKAMRDFETALDYQTQFVVLQDSLNSQKAYKALSEQHVAYLLEKQEKELEITKQQSKVQKLELERSRNLVYVGFVVLVLFIGLLFSLYARFQQKQRANELLEEKNIEIQHRADVIQAQAEEIGLQNAIILDNHLVLTDSIQYAKRIQDALTTDEKKIQQMWQDIFIFYQPKDIVSGDFYWFDVCLDAENELEKVIIVVADCTGHGVPGAFMTVLGHSLINQIIREQKIIEPQKILQELDKSITKLLHQEKSKYASESNADGMDIAIGVWDLPTRVMTFGSAKRPLYHLQKEQINIYAGNRFPIGGNEYRETKVFTQIEIPAQRDDVFYFFTDGFADQFGENPNVKFSTKRLRELIQEIGRQGTLQQKGLFRHFFEKWRGNQKQTDDVLLVGFKV